MADVFSWWQQDLVILPTGDLLVADGTIEGEQRVMRRFLTSPGKYIWHLNYGAGLPNYVGQPAMADAVASLMTSQMMLEDVVSQQPLPVVSVKTNALGYMNSDVKYVDANTGAPVALDFNVDN